MKQKILVVEDEEGNLYLMRYLLEKKGYIVVEARDGVEAVSIAISDKPELIIMDMDLPRLNGYEATRILKSDKRTSHIPIVAVTASGMPGDREKILNTGCNEYILKPIEPDKLIKVIERYLGEEKR